MPADVFADGEPLKASPNRGVARAKPPAMAAEKAVCGNGDQVPPGAGRPQHWRYGPRGQGGR